MLNVDPDRRPNIFQVLERVSILRNCACPIQNVTFIFFKKINKIKEVNKNKIKLN